MAELAARHRAVAIDFGTGDGAFVQHAARRAPDTLVIGVDANVDNLRDASRRALAKPARGGLPNALFGVLALDDAPGALVGLADALTVVLPWGRLLAAVATGDAPALGRLRDLCKPGAEVRLLFGFGPADAAALAALGVRPGDDQSFIADLVQRHRSAGMLVEPREVALEEVRALPTTWAKKLAFSGKPRRFWALEGRTAAAPRPRMP